MRYYVFVNMFLYFEFVIGKPLIKIQDTMSWPHSFIID